MIHVFFGSTGLHFLSENSGRKILGVLIFPKMTYARSLFLFSSATIGELLVVIEILMNSGTKKYYEKYKNIYDSRNFNELGNP